MADKTVANIKSLTTGVSNLTKQVNDLAKALDKVNTSASKAIKSASGVASSGGHYGLGHADRPGTGADDARFPERGGGQYPSNLMSYSLARFNYPTNPFMPNIGMGGMGVAGAAGLGIGQAVMGAASGLYQMMPGVNDTLGRAYGYYRAGLTSPGINRNQLERATFRAMGGGLSSAGSDATVAAALAGMGYTPGSLNYLRATSQVGGAYKYLGMSNEAAAQAIGGMQTGPMAANLFQYGITTFDAATGKEKTTGQIARELMNYMTGGAKVSTEEVRRSFQKGALGANLRNMGFSQDQQSMLYQAMIDLSSGRNPDLQTATPMKGNENTFLTAQGRINASTTDIMMTAENKMIKGFENAADTVEFLNRQLKNFADELGYLVGYIGGVTGTPAGKGGMKVGKSILGGLMIGAGALMDITGVGAAAGVPLMIAGAGVMASGGGGGSTGFGAAFGVGNRNNRGGGAVSVGSNVTAGYGATDNSANSPWTSSNGTHTGIDYAMPVGTPVKSAFDGVVSAVNINADYGTSIMVDNANGTQAIYGHLSEKSVKVGDRISQGQVIGKSGESGNANGPHLHFEIRDAKNHPVNPQTVLSGDGYAGKLFANYSTINPTKSDLTGTAGSGTASTSSRTVSNYIRSYATGSQDGLSNSALRDVLSAAGFKGQALETAMAVARAESGGIPGRHSDPSLLKDDSYGLFQINMLGQMGVRRNANYLKQYGQYGYTGPESLYNPEINARIAYDISKGGSNWSDAWVNTSKKLGIGGGSTGYGAKTTSSVASGNKTVNFYIKVDKVSEEEAVKLAKRVKYHLQDDFEVSSSGGA